MVYMHVHYSGNKLDCVTGKASLSLSTWFNTTHLVTWLSYVMHSHTSLQTESLSLSCHMSHSCSCYIVAQSSMLFQQWLWHAPFSVLSLSLSLPNPSWDCYVTQCHFLVTLMHNLAINHIPHHQQSTSFSVLSQRSPHNFPPTKPIHI